MKNCPNCEPTHSHHAVVTVWNHKVSWVPLTWSQPHVSVAVITWQQTCTDSASGFNADILFFSSKFQLQTLAVTLSHSSVQRKLNLINTKPQLMMKIETTTKNQKWAESTEIKRQEIPAVEGPTLRSQWIYWRKLWFQRSGLVLHLLHLLHLHLLHLINTTNQKHKHGWELPLTFTCLCWLFLFGVKIKNMI